MPSAPLCPTCQQPVPVSFNSERDVCSNCKTPLRFVLRDRPGGRWIVADEAIDEHMTPDEAADFLRTLPSSGTVGPDLMSKIVEAYMVLQARPAEDISRAKRVVLGIPEDAA